MNVVAKTAAIIALLTLMGAPASDLRFSHELLDMNLT